MDTQYQFQARIKAQLSHQMASLWLVQLALLAWTAVGYAAPGGDSKLPIGSFVAAKVLVKPVMDGELKPGEWDRAVVTSGLITPFDHSLQEAKTTVGFAFDEERFYFYVDSIRGDKEWKLWKSVRENDGYSFGDPSVEIWVTPPALVPETYQSVINTYPAVLDMKMIPTRGYTAQGWRANWDIGVKETETRYVLEASLPVSDMDGFEKVTMGEVWRFLLCRTSPGTQSRAQASWSITQGFSELNQHPTVTLVEDSSMLQVRNISSLCSGAYDLELTGIGAAKAVETLDVEVRFHDKVQFGDDDRVEKRTLNLKAGERQVLHMAGKLAPEKAGYLTITAKNVAGVTVFSQAWPYKVSGWEPKMPTRPENAREEQPLDLMVNYGPVHNVAIVRADIIDLPGRENVAGGVVKVVDPGSNKVLAEQSLGAFKEWYSSVNFKLDGVKIPLADYSKLDYIKTQNENLEKENKKRIARGQDPLPLKTAEIPEPMTVRIDVSVVDGDGNELRTASRNLDLRRYKFSWENNSIGTSDDVIPPWTPLTYKGGKVGVWNRDYDFNGLGLLDSVTNDGLQQISKMRLVAIKDGKEIEIRAGAPELDRHVPAEARFNGSGAGAGLRLEANTEVEFDGFVLSKLTIGSDDNNAPASIDGLYLEVVLPESEATHFCATAGGWSAVHAKTPAYWSSQITSSGVMIGDFVPYVWLTNSERAFMWFADNDKGWITDDDRSSPTQEVIRENGTVTLRVHFVELPTTFTEPTTLEYGYQTFPSRPLPEGWRTIICGTSTARLPDAKNTYFWFDGNWAVLWPYYSSPYAWNWEKSRKEYERILDNPTHRPMVGSIAHSIGRYRDYEGTGFGPYSVDWGETPGQIGNSDVTQNKGATDFRLYHYREWVRRAGFRGLYVDENYLSFDRNFLSGGAYMRQDGRLQIGYSYLGLREYFKRFRYMMHDERVPAPFLWQHISSGSAYNAWFGDIFFEGENVEPTNLEFDYLKVLPAERMRAIGSSRTAGGAMTMMCQPNRHRTQWADKHIHQFLGWVMAHDILPEQVSEYELIAQAAQFYRPTTFLPYWRDDTPLKTDKADVIVSAHRNASRTTAWIVNTSRQATKTRVTVDYAALGFTATPVVVNAETGERLAADESGFSTDVLERDFVVVYLLPLPPPTADGITLSAGTAFVSTFENGPRADYALGADIWESLTRGRSGVNPSDLPLTLGNKGKGKGLLVEDGVAMRPHLNATDTHGTLLADVQLTDAKRGSIFAAAASSERENPVSPVPTLHLEVDGKELVFGLKELVKNRASWIDDKVLRIPRPEAGWHQLTLVWADGQVVLSIDGKPAGTLPMERLNICSGTGKAMLSSGQFAFGDRSRAVIAIDNVMCTR